MIRSHQLCPTSSACSSIRYINHLSSQPLRRSPRILTLRSHPEYFAHIHPLVQIITALRAQVQQGNMTHKQALDRLAMMQASAHSSQEQPVPQQLPPGFNAAGVPSGNAHRQMDTLSQHAQVSANNQQINNLAIQAQDASHARQMIALLLGQQQQQQNGSDIASRMGQNLDPSGMGLPQGPGSVQQIPQPGAQQVSGPPGNLVDVPLPQLCALSTQLLHVVIEGEIHLQAPSSFGEGDIQRQQLRAKIDLNKLRLSALHEVINMKRRPR